MAAPTAFRTWLLKSCFVGVLAAALGGCASIAESEHPLPRYLVSAASLSVGLGPTGLCVAVDPNDSQGVWWWEPGASGCASRSTGPELFAGQRARVSRAGRDGSIDVTFQVAVHSQVQPYTRVRIVVEGGQMRVTGTDARAATIRRDELDIPEMPIR